MSGASINPAEAPELERHGTANSKEIADNLRRPAYAGLELAEGFLPSFGRKEAKLATPEQLSKTAQLFERIFTRCPAAGDSRRRDFTCIDEHSEDSNTSRRVITLVKHPEGSYTLQCLDSLENRYTGIVLQVTKNVLEYDAQGNEMHRRGFGARLRPYRPTYELLPNALHGNDYPLSILREWDRFCAEPKGSGDNACGAPCAHGYLTPGATALVEHSVADPVSYSLEASLSIAGSEDRLPDETELRAAFLGSRLIQAVLSSQPSVTEVLPEYIAKGLKQQRRGCSYNPTAIAPDIVFDVESSSARMYRTLQLVEYELLGYLLKKTGKEDLGRILQLKPADLVKEVEQCLTKESTG